MTLVTEYKPISIDDDSKVTGEVKHILTGQFTNFMEPKRNFHHYAMECKSQEIQTKFDYQRLPVRSILSSSIGSTFIHI